MYVNRPKETREEYARRQEQNAIRKAQYEAQKQRNSFEKYCMDQGYEARRAGNYLQAIQAYTQVLNQNYTHSNALLQRGYCHKDSGNLSAAINDYLSALQSSDVRKAEEIKTALGRAYSEMGKKNLENKNYQATITEQQQALQYLHDSQDKAFAHYHLTIAYKEMQNFQMAIHELESAIHFKNDKKFIL